MSVGLSGPVIHRTLGGLARIHSPSLKDLQEVPDPGEENTWNDCRSDTLKEQGQGTVQPARRGEPEA